MKLKINEFFAKIRKIDLRTPFFELLERIVTRKKDIYGVVLAMASIFLVSFLIENFGFGRNFNQYRFFLFSAILLLTVFFIVFRKKIGQYPEVAFLVVVLVCGTLLIMSEPRKFVSWDEEIHYKRVERLAANSDKDMFFRPNFVKYSFSIDEQKEIDAFVNGRYKKPKTKSPSDSLNYKEVAYVPAAIGLAVGNVLHLPYYLVFLLGRWFSLLVYAVVVFFAIRKLKSGKMIMSIIALFPTSIFLAVNYGYDQWVIAFTMLGMGYLLSELQQPERKISVKDMVIMIGSFVIGIGPKAIYFPLMLTLFLLGRTKFETNSQYRKYLFASVVSILFVLGSFLLPFLISGEGSGGSRGKLDVDTPRQMQFIFSHPLEYTKILFNFIKDYINPMNASGFTNFFAYLGMTKGFYVVLALVALVTLTDKNDYDRKTSGWINKATILLAYFSTIALFSTALYLSFTVVGSSTIDGVQPRYLLPLIFPLLFFIGGKGIKNRLNKNIYNSLIFALMSGILLFGIWELLIRNYY